MTDMICGKCGRYGIEWRGLHGLYPYTKCPHCNGMNCHVKEHDALENDENSEVDDAKGE
jgi:hypothetical protein